MGGANRTFHALVAVATALLVGASLLPLWGDAPEGGFARAALRALLVAVGGGALLLATRRARRGDPAPIKVAWVVVLVAFVLPSYVGSYHPTEGWTAWIQFGGFYDRGAVPALQATPHHVVPGGLDSVGYDGQFYAQVALDPLLLRPAELDEALENPCYRARRILVPAAAHLVGAGRPRRVLEAFVLLHGAFFVLLLALLTHRRLVGPFGLRAALVLAAAGMSAGVTTCMARCLPDLPAAVLVVASLVVPARWGPWTIALAGLARNTGLAGLVALPWAGSGRAAWRRHVVAAFIAVAPAALWGAYASSRLRCEYPFGIGNIDWPFVGIAQRLVRAWQEVGAQAVPWGRLPLGPLDDFALQELLTVLCILVQMAWVVGYAVRRGRHAVASPLVRLGLVFTVLGLCLGEVVWQGTAAAARVLLPLCIVFNLLLLRSRPWVFGLLLVAGNLYSLPAALSMHVPAVLP